VSATTSVKKGCRITDSASRASPLL
jgi:hypothetical protein